MHKLSTGFAMAATLVLLASAGQACEWHAAQVTASISKTDEGASMSTYDGATAPVIMDESANAAAAAADCPKDATGCVPAGE